MYILHIIPISRAMSRERLTYWSPENVLLGAVVHVPLRSREIPGIVVKAEPAADVKSEVRSSEFRLRKITDRTTVPLFSPALIEAAEQTAIHTASTTGAVLGALLPAPLLENIENLALNPDRWKSDVRSGVLSEELVFQSEEEDRLTRYKSLIRESFARGESVYLCVPTIVDVEHLEEALGRGIEEYTVLLHSGLSKKQARENLSKIMHNEHPVLIVGTGSYITAERPDIKTIIIERENSRAYKLPARPYIDLRYFIEAYAKTRKIRLIFGGLPLRIETLWRYEAHELSDLMPPMMRLLNGAPHAVIDMREKKDRLPGKATGSEFEVLSSEVKEMLAHAIEHGDRCLLFVARRGLAPLTVCQDCGSVVRGTHDDAPMVLHRSPSGNVFVSHVTGEVRDAHERCKVCQSWRLEALGIGVERVEAELEAAFPALKLFRVDQDAAATHKQTRSALRKFYATPGSALIATERVLAYLSDSVEHSAVISIDSLLSLPEWKVSERTFSLLLKIRAITQKSYLVQTRKADQSIIVQALKGNVGEFYRNEIALREALGYPPFTVLIKFSIVGTLARSTEELQKLLTYLEPFGIEPYPAPLHVGRNRYACHALIRVERTSWPDAKLLSRLTELPPYIAVDVNPEHLL